MPKDIIKCENCGATITDPSTSTLLAEGQLCTACSDKLSCLTGGWKKLTIEDVEIHLTERLNDLKLFNERFKETDRAGDLIVADKTRGYFYFTIGRDYKQKNPVIFRADQIIDFSFKPLFSRIDEVDKLDEKARQEHNMKMLKEFEEVKFHFQLMPELRFAKIKQGDFIVDGVAWLNTGCTIMLHTEHRFIRDVEHTLMLEPVLKTPEGIPYNTSRQIIEFNMKAIAIMKLLEELKASAVSSSAAMGGDPTTMNMMGMPGASLTVGNADEFSVETRAEDINEESAADFSIPSGSGLNNSSISGMFSGKPKRAAAENQNFSSTGGASSMFGNPEAPFRSSSNASMPNFGDDDDYAVDAEDSFMPAGSGIPGGSGMSPNMGAMNPNMAQNMGQNMAQNMGQNMGQAQNFAFAASMFNSSQNTQGQQRQAPPMPFSGSAHPMPPQNLSPLQGQAPNAFGQTQGDFAAGQGRNMAQNIPPNMAANMAANMSANMTNSPFAPGNFNAASNMASPFAPSQNRPMPFAQQGQERNQAFSSFNPNPGNAQGAPNAQKAQNQQGFNPNMNQAPNFGQEQRQAQQGHHESNSVFDMPGFDDDDDN